MTYYVSCSVTKNLFFHVWASYTSAYYYSLNDFDNIQEGMPVKQVLSELVNSRRRRESLGRLWSESLGEFFDHVDKLSDETSYIVEFENLQDLLNFVKDQALIFELKK